MDTTQNVVLIDFDKLTLPSTRILLYRTNGEITRKALKLDSYDKDDTKIMIVSIPYRIYSMNISFFLGCFGPSVITLGEEAFRKKYIFKHDQILNNAMENNIARAVKLIEVEK